MNQRIAWSAAAGLAILAALALLSVRWSSEPNTGPGIFDNASAFDAYVAGLGLTGASPPQVAARLAAEGFHCQAFADGTASCHRKVRGSRCAEQQFIDIPAGNGTSPGVSTRFGLTCR